MKLRELMEVYTGDSLITIDGYCEEKRYNYYTMPPKGEVDFSGKNPYIRYPTCLAREPWYKEIKNKKIKRLAVIEEPGNAWPTMRIELEKEDR